MAMANGWGATFIERPGVLVAVAMGVTVPVP